MKTLAQTFSRDTGHRVKLSFGATGHFYAQIKSGAPFQVLIAADDETPMRLAAEGYGVPASRFTYATGRLILWSRTPGLVDAQGSILRQGGFSRLAIASPKLAPYGAAAIEVLERLGLKDTLASKLVEGANISQAFQFVASGNAPLGFVALSQVLENGIMKQGSGWVVPPHMHQPIRQDALLLKKGETNDAAQAFLRFLQTEKAKAIIRSFGYEVS
jgi:molybdate transport system substrate-binding protein